MNIDKDEHHTWHTLGINTRAAAYATRIINKLFLGETTELKQYQNKYCQKDVEYIQRKYNEALKSNGRLQKRLCLFCHHYHDDVKTKHAGQNKFQLKEICAQCFEEEKVKYE